MSYRSSKVTWCLTFSLDSFSLTLTMSRKGSTLAMPQRFARAGRVSRPSNEPMSIEAIRERRARLESMLSSNNFRLPPLKTPSSSSSKTPVVQQPSRPSSRTPLPDIGSSRPGSQESAQEKKAEKQKEMTKAKEKEKEREKEKEKEKEEVKEKEEEKETGELRTETKERHEQQQEEMMERMRKQMQELMQQQMQELMQRQMRDMQTLLEQQMEHRINYTQRIGEVSSRGKSGDGAKEQGKKDQAGKKEEKEKEKGEKDRREDESKAKSKEEESSKTKGGNQQSGKKKRELKRKKDEEDKRKELEDELVKKFQERNKVVHSAKMRETPLYSDDAFLPGDNYTVDVDYRAFTPEQLSCATAPQTPFTEEHPVQYPGNEQHVSEDNEELQRADDEQQVSEEEEKQKDENEEDKENENGEEKDQEKEEDPKTEGEKPQDDEDEEGDSDEEDISDAKDDIVEGLKSQDKRRQLVCAEKARHLLSSPRPPLNQLIAAGILPPLVLCMARQDAPELQLESAWAVTNIASGKSKHTNAVVDAGAIKVLIQLLSSKNTGVREQAVWALGNIVGDGPECRDQAIAEGLVKPLVGLLSVTTPASIARQVCWVITNLFRVKHPVISPEERKMCAEAIRRLVSHFDAKVQADSLWAAAYFADMGSGSIDELIECGAVKDMVQRLYSQDDKVVTAALRATGSIAAGANHQTEAVVTSGALPIYRDLLGHSNAGIASETAWILSNVTAGTPSQIQMVIDVQVVPALMTAVEKRNEELQKEASWALCNMVSGGTEEQISMLVSLGTVSSFCHLLKSQDMALVMLGLEAISNVFTKSQNEEATARLVEGVGGLETLRGLQSSQDPKVAQTASTLLALFFSSSRRSSYGY
ncbi:importin subunit alpha-3-like isoform X3 [Penaeus chinensis]|uniref:importin subunit alpha-3-like isoform X3 n=1 Tax=Penaeus chinensis TaxID=139456 RepID=UPI001FB62BFA|nr:importin subunit alpha-3-like isoform X3 [Penaeus chinensis]